jgi:hypothetical protein
MHLLKFAKENDESKKSVGINHLLKQHQPYSAAPEEHH